MSDTTLITGVSVSTLSRKKSLAETKDCIRWYSWLEGDTLVVDTIGQNTKTVVDAYRTPHSDKLHVVERWRMVDNGNTLEVLVTVDDSDTYNQPWQGLRRYRRAQGQLGEQICAEGNFLLFDYGVPVAKTPDF